MNETLNKILSVYSPSGCEKENSKSITDLLLKYTNEIEIDALSNIIGYVHDNRIDNKRILLDAHYDEVSLVVTAIEENGFLRFNSHVGADIRCLIASEVVVHAQTRLPGAVTSTPPHLTTITDKYPKDSELFVDTGLDYNKLKEIVSIGDRITYKENANSLLDTKIYSKGLDNKLSIYVILEVLEKIKQNNLFCDVATLFSTSEEFNASGAATGAFKTNPDVAIVIDVSFATTPDTDAIKCGVSSKGVMIGVSPTLDINISNKLRELAAINNIPYQIEIMAGETGTNATAITTSKKGIATALVSIPIKYMHTNVEMVDTADLKSVIDIIYEYIKFVSKENRLW